MAFILNGVTEEDMEKLEKIGRNKYICNLNVTYVVHSDSEDEARKEAFKMLHMEDEYYKYFGWEIDIEDDLLGNLTDLEEFEEEE